MNELFEQHRREVLNQRGIADSLIDAEPLRYRSFAKGDWQTYARLMRLRQVQPSIKGKVAQSGGIVITRYGVNGRTKPPPYGRFDVPLYWDQPPRQPKFPGQGKTRYAYRRGHAQMRIDVHPLVAPHLGTGEPVYFCLEGCLKADAVLSAGALAFSSTSVTTWKNADLLRLLPTLRSARVVYVIPDSDYYSSPRRNGYFNPMVLYQTRAAAQWLQTRRVNALIAVPWTGQVGVKIGIDDYLHLGYPLDKLLVDPVPPYPGLAIGPALRWTKAQASVLEHLTRLNGPFGTFIPYEVAKALGVSRQTVLRAYKKFESMGIMRVWPGGAFMRDGQWRNEPHSFVMLGAAGSYLDYLKRLAVPNPYARPGQPRPGRGWEGASPFELLEAESA